ncbi:MAG: helix-turn-helix domain-containing protein [Chloroflexota bacterium]
MVRSRLSRDERQRGLELWETLRAARGSRSAVDIAASAGVSVETVRKIEHGLVPTPTFFTVAAIAQACGVSLDQLASEMRMRISDVAPHLRTTA